MEFGFRPLSNSGIVPLTASDTGNQQKQKSRTDKPHRSEASRTSNIKSHETFSKNHSLRRVNILLQVFVALKFLPAPLGIRKNARGRICAFRMKHRTSQTPEPTAVELQASSEQSQPLPWHPFTRLAFRLAFSYFGLYAVVSHLLVYLFVPPNTLPGQGVGTLWPLSDITSWTAVHVFGITEPLVYTGNSRDTNFFWVQLFVVLIIAILATIAWSVLDRRREQYDALYRYFRLFMRFALAAQMIYFGMVKVIPTQFPAPSLLTLVAPVGNLSLQGLLWTSIGASTAYQIFTGVVEVIGGLLLLTPQTTALGAIVCLISMSHVFVLNMTYDVGVKILSFQLALISLVLLAPDFPRLTNVLLLNRPAGVSPEPELFRTRRSNRIAFVVQIVVGLYLAAAYADVSRTFWYAEGGGGTPKSPLYGIWNVDELAIDGQVRPSELNDYDRRWRRVIFDAPRWIYFQRTDDSFIRYGAAVDMQGMMLALTKGTSRSWSSSFKFVRPAPDRLLFEGQMDGYRINMKLQRVEFDTFRLLKSSFRWMRPPDPESE